MTEPEGEKAAAGSSEGQPTVQGTTQPPPPPPRQAATLAPEREFDFAEKLITQVATLASAILALSVTFAHDWSDSLDSGQRNLLRWSWILMAVSLVFGLVSLSALAGMAHSRVGDIKSNLLRVPWIVQVVTFMLGLGLMVWLGLAVLGTSGTPSPGAGSAG